jgi:2'-5' RNA ligase
MSDKPRALSFNEFENTLNERKEIPGEKHEYSCALLVIEGEIKKEIMAVVEEIPDTELTMWGKEDEPHITVKFGLHADTDDELAKLVKGFGPLTVQLGEISIFGPNTNKETGELFEVVKIEVSGEDIFRLNRLICDNMEYTDSFPDYTPHLTLAYVKEGEGSKYIGSCAVTGRSITFDKVQFSDKTRDKTNLSL